MTSRKAIYTAKGAPPKGPYSQGIVAQGPMLFVSSQGPVDPETGAFIEGSFGEKAEQVFRNITTILEEAGTSWDQVVKIGVLLDDMDSFATMNEIYAEYVQEPFPARTTAQSNIGDKAILVDCIALVPA